MNILLKDQIDNYRFAVAKIVFLLVEDRYKYIEDIPYSNLMLVRNIETKEKIYISILSKPTDKSFSKKLFMCITKMQVIKDIILQSIIKMLYIII